MSQTSISILAHFHPSIQLQLYENARRKKERSFHLSCETPPLTPSPYLSALPPDPLALLDPGPSSTELVCIRKLAVRTNCPTAAQNPLRKALKGCSESNISNNLPRESGMGVYIVPGQHTISELHTTNKHEKGHEGV
jgi:hypothetical protein